MMNLIPLQTYHLPLLHDWLNQAHMRIFYQLEPISLPQVIQKYKDRITQKEPVFCHIANKDNIPFGFIQSYKISDYPEYAAEIGVGSGISLDLFIGEPLYLRRGLGQQMLQQYIEHIVFKIFPNENHCYICHEINHISAIKCSIAVGFKYIKDVIEEGKLCQLLIYDKCFEKNSYHINHFFAG